MGLLVNPVCQADQPETGYQPAKTEYHEVIKQVPSELGRNCVSYARTKADLPQGLFTLQDKLSKANSSAGVGKVGVTAEGPNGHLVYVLDIERDKILVEESNYIHGFITQRWVDKNVILGYF